MKEKLDAENQTTETRSPAPSLAQAEGRVRSRQKGPDRDRGLPPPGPKHEAPNVDEIECWSCAVRAPAGTLGWESDTERIATLGRRNFCPKHRRKNPALASLGELVQSRRERKDRHAHPKDR